MPAKFQPVMPEKHEKFRLIAKTIYDCLANCKSQMGRYEACFGRAKFGLFVDLRVPAPDKILDK